MQGLHSHNSYRLGECFFYEKITAYCYEPCMHAFDSGVRRAERSR